MRSVSTVVAVVLVVLLFQAVQAVPPARADYKPFVRTTESYGAFTRNRASSGHTMNYDIVVRDFDGIPDGGTNYTVTVEKPSGISQTLNFDGLESWHTAYWWYGGDPVVDGNYTFTVEDPTGNIFTIVDAMTSTAVPIINPVTITANGTSPTISWSAVSGATHYQVRIYKTSTDNSVWKQRVNQPQHTVPPGVLDPNTEYYVRVRAFINHRGFYFQETDDYSESADYAFTTGAVSEAPYFALDFWHFLGGWSNPYEGPLMGVEVHLFDAQGLDTVNKVYVILPDGTTVAPLYFAGSNGDYDGYFRTGYPNLITGTYTFVAEDMDGHVVTQTTDYYGDTVSVVDNSSLSPGHNTVLSGDFYTFTWDRLPDATYYDIEFLDQNGNTATTLAVADTGSNPVVPIPVDAFYEGMLLKWRVKAYSDWGENDPKGQSISEIDHQANNFRSAYVAGTAEGPVLDSTGRGVFLHHTNKWDLSDTEYVLETYVKVTDQDGVPGNIQYVRVTYPGGGSQELSFSHNDSTTEGYYNYAQVFTDSGSVPSGTYTITVVDAEGHENTLNDDLIPIDLDVPQNCRPVNGTHVSDRPRVQCDEVTGATKYQFRVYEGWDNLKTQSNYEDTFGGRPDPGELEKNSLYRYAAYAFTGDPDTDIDNLSSNMEFTPFEPYFITDKGEGGGAWQLLLLDD